MFFSEDKISEIIEQNDIVTLISQYLSLNKRGKNFWGLCPFHSEKTPSFSVSMEKQLFYCFGCGAGGNVITFIQKIERLSFVESLYFLAKRAGIEIDTKASKEDLERVKEKETLYKINSESARFFYENMKKNSNAKSYLSRRGLEQSVIRKFGLGYSLDSWDKLKVYLNNLGYSDYLIEKAGLIVKRENGYYDRFRNRIMFPIIDLRGNVIAFGGRVLDGSKPKYLNSPETPIYSKSNSIYALNMVRKLTALKRIIIVEGYMDVIALCQFGIKNVVASLGTAFTQQQAKLLKRYAEEIIIAYDPDAAGESATIRGLSMLEKEGCNVKILSFPEGMDPDDFIRKKGAEQFNKLLKKSHTLIDYRIISAKQDFNFDRIEDRIEFSKSLASILSALESPVEIDAYIKKYSKEIHISEEAIYAELKKNKRKHISGNNRHNINNGFSKERRVTSGLAIVEKKVINICVSNKNLAINVFDKVKPEDFSIPLHEKVAKIINLKIKEGKMISPGEILIHLADDQESQNVSEIFSIDITKNDINLLDSYISKIEQYNVENKIDVLTKKMNEYFDIEDKDKANDIFMKILDLQKKKK